MRKNKFNSLIGEGRKPFIIAEVSANHNGSFLRAKKLISAAKSVGASAVKIQSYEAESMTINVNKPDFQIKHGLWKGKKLFKLYDEAKTPFLWHKKLFSHAKKEGILIFSSPFDFKAVDLLEELKVPMYKVASFEITDLPLIEYISKKKKPMLISTGMASETEIGEAIEVVKSNGVKDILLFHCISSYPSRVEEYNLKMIKTLKKQFKTFVGLSDHTLGIEAATASIALGAVAIEKHFALNTKLKGPDSAFSIEPEEMKKLILSCNNVWKGLGKGSFKRSLKERKNKVFRRSIYFVKELAKGEKIKKEDIRVIRPGLALAPKYYKQILGRKINKNVKPGDRVELKNII